MDPVSLTLGGLPIAAQLLSSCFTGYQIISQIFTASEESQITLCQLQIEETRLRLWAQDVSTNAEAEDKEGVLDRRLDEWGIRNVVLLILAHMAGIFVNTKQLRSRYGILRGQSSSEQIWSGPLIPELPHATMDAAVSLRKGQGALGEQEKAIRKYAEQTQSSLSFLRKARFVLNDKRKFTGFLEQLRYFNDALNSLVSRSSSQHVALDLALSAKIISATAVDAELETIGAASEKSYEPLSASATLKRLRLSIQVSKGQINGFPNIASPYLSNTEIRKKWALLKLENRNAHRSLGLYGEHGKEQPVIVEWKYFDRSLPRDDTVDRIQDIARYLHASSSCRSPDLPVLECIGYVEDVEQPRCCFLYLLPGAFASPAGGPPTTTSANVTIRTLADLIPARFTRTAVPSLEHRYRLAQALAIALFRLHLTGWLHKGIRSSNVVFLAGPDDKDKSDLVRSPWLLGFDYSRPDKVTAVSDRAPTEMASSEWDLYMHPDYRTLRHVGPAGSNDDGRYKRLYDIYSLGLVLLEIALWEPLSTFRRKEQTAADFKAAVLKIAEGEVGGAMGEKYRDVVVACINGTALAESKEEGLEVYLKAVVNKLLMTTI